jgi:hypothetical protein
MDFFGEFGIVDYKYVGYEDDIVNLYKYKY